jgi:hypothetical protein
VAVFRSTSVERARDPHATSQSDRAVATNGVWTDERLMVLIRASARGFSRASARMHSCDGRLTLRDLPRAHPFKEPAYQHCNPKRANQLLPFAITDHVGSGLDRIP